LHNILISEASLSTGRFASSPILAVAEHRLSNVRPCNRPDARHSNEIESQTQVIFANFSSCPGNQRNWRFATW
jgi:hypothetical protein